MKLAYSMAYQRHVVAILEFFVFKLKNSDTPSICIDRVSWYNGVSVISDAIQQRF